MFVLAEVEDVVLSCLYFLFLFGTCSGQPWIKPHISPMELDLHAHSHPPGPSNDGSLAYRLLDLFKVSDVCTSLKSPWPRKVSLDVKHEVSAVMVANMGGRTG